MTEILRKAQRQMVAVIPIHQRDADLWLDQLLAEMERLDWDVAWHLDRLNAETRERIHNWRGTIGYTIGSDSGGFRENHREGALQIAQNSGAEWFINHDADETFEPNAPALIAALLAERKLYMLRWYNVWEVRDGVPMIRVDGSFIRTRYRLHPIGPWRYAYNDPNTATPAALRDDYPPLVQTGVRILHWGFSTPEQRQWHYDFWHGRVLHGGKPAGFWAMVMEPTEPRLRAFDPSLTHEQWMALP